MAEELKQYEVGVDRYFTTLPEQCFEQVPCLFCGNSQRKYPLFTKGTMEVYRCQCGFVWNGRQPNSQALHQFYKESEAMTKWAEHKSSPHQEQRQIEKYSKAIDFLIGAGIESVLDVGCGTGKFLSLLKDKNVQIREYGIDSNVASLQKARADGLNVKLMSMDDIPFNLRFDAVCLWGVLEHVKDPKKVLAQCIDHLAPGGFLVICVPNVNSLVVTELWKECFTFCPQHLWYFSKFDLHKLTLAHGLKEILSYTIEPELRPIVNKALGFPPYSELEYQTLQTERIISKVLKLIKTNDLGYKIVKISQLPNINEYLKAA